MAEINTTAAYKHIGKLNNSSTQSRNGAKLLYPILHARCSPTLAQQHSRLCGGFGNLIPMQNHSWMQTQLHKTLHGPIWFLH